MAINDPRDIPGLVVWYSAEAEAANYIDGDSMTGWTDLSGNGNHATAGVGAPPVWKSAESSAGGAAVDFGGNRFFDLPDNLMTGAAAGSYAVNLWANTGNNGGWNVSGSGGMTHVIYGGTLYDTFGTTNQQVVVASAVQTWYRYQARSKSTEWKAWRDGTAVFTSTSNVVSWATTNYWIGQSANGSWQFNGKLTSFVMYGRDLTDAEIADLDAWMAANPSGGTAAASTTVAVGQVVESDTANPVTPTTAGELVIPIGQAVENDGACPFTISTPAGVFVNIGQATETDTALPVAAAVPPTVYATKRSNLANGRPRIGIGYHDIEPPVVEPPTPLATSVDKALVYPVPTLDSGRVVGEYKPTVLSQPSGRHRILVRKRDITWFRGKHTPLPPYRLTEPYEYGATVLTIPQIAPYLESGSLPRWVRIGAEVKFQTVTDNPRTVTTDYIGVVTGIDTDGPELRLIVGGEVSGRAILRNRQVPLFRFVRDIGRLIDFAAKDIGFKLGPRFGPVTGVELTATGGMTYLGYLDHLHTMSWKRDGSSRALMRKPGSREYEFRLKDRDTKHVTAYFDDTRVVARLRRDIAEEPTTFYGTTVLDDGTKVKNARYPGLVPGSAPAFPGPLSLGATGGDVTALHRALIRGGYLSDEDVTGTFGPATENAVRELQDQAGLDVTGVVNEATWNAAFDISVTGLSLRQARVFPFVQDPRVRKYNYTATGAVAGVNPRYRRGKLEVDRNEDFGHGQNKAQIRTRLRAEKDRLTDSNWVGTISLHGVGLIDGEHNPGDPTPASMVPLRALRPGMNVWAPLWDGGTLLHISYIEVEPGNGPGVPDTATLHVDTAARDALQVGQIIARNRESRRNPTREWIREQRESQQVKDSMITADEYFGRTFEPHFCKAGEWTVIPVIGGQEGQVSQIRLETYDTPAEFCVALTGKRISGPVMNRQVGNPFPVDEDGDTVWNSDAVQAWLSGDTNRFLLGAWGDEEQPGGYWPKRHTNRNGEVTTHPITGVFKDAATFTYRTFGQPVIYMAVYPDRDTYIREGRVMWVQHEEGA